MYYTLQDIQKDIQKDIGKNQLRKAVRKLERWLVEDKDPAKHLLLLKGRFSELRQEEIVGVVAEEQRLVRYAKIRKSILDFMDTLEGNDFSQEAIMQEGIHDRFLVLYEAEEGRENIERYFNKIYFSNVDYRHYENCPEGKPLEDYSFILFDFMQSSSTKLHYLMEDILKNEDLTVPVLYFGRKRSPIIDKDIYAEKAQAANSVFSLYARIKEILDYQKYFQVITTDLS